MNWTLEQVAQALAVEMPQEMVGHARVKGVSKSKKVSRS